MTNPFDELGDLDDAFAAIDEDVERRIDADSPQTAMMLTQTEWTDLAVMVEHYKKRAETSALAHLSRPAIQRRIRLAERMIEANQ